MAKMSKREQMRQLKEQRMQSMKASVEAEQDAEQVTADLKEEPVMPEEHPAQDKELPVEKEETAEKKEAGQADGLTIEAESDERKESEVLDNHYKSSAAECKTITLMLRSDNAEYTNIRSRQLGMAYQDYLGLLIEEERRRVDLGDINAFSIQHPKRGTAVRKLAAIRLDVNDFLKKSAMAHGMRISEYANYIIDNERIREEKNGFRQQTV